jgi:hypothetical protein
MYICIYIYINICIFPIGWNDSRNIGSEAVLLGDGTPVPAVFIDDAVAIMVYLKMYMHIYNSLYVIFISTCIHVHMNI